MSPFPPIEKPLPPVPIYGPIPKELMRNMPRWVYRLQFVGYCLMAPFAVAYLLALLYERTGILLP